MIINDGAEVAEAEAVHPSRVLAAVVGAEIHIRASEVVEAEAAVEAVRIHDAAEVAVEAGEDNNRRRHHNNDDGGDACHDLCRDQANIYL